MKFYILFFPILCTTNIFAYKIDSTYVESSTMKRNIPVTVIVPDKAQSDSCPVLFLLHGYGGNQYTWLNIQPDLPLMSDRDGVIIVCPDGETSWYWDSPVKHESQFETFISKDLVCFIDANYNTIQSRAARAISGLSMGGQGALRIAIRHSDVFSACGSMSGGVDVRPFPKSWNIEELLGEYKKNKKIWAQFTVQSQLNLISDGELSIIIDCGYSDFFYQVNFDLSKALLKEGIDHDFIVRPGEHNHEYWRNSIKYQWLFFVETFKDLIR